MGATRKKAYRELHKVLLAEKDRYLKLNYAGNAKVVQRIIDRVVL